MNPTYERLVTLLAETCRIDPATVRPDSTLESLGIDSLGAAELLFNAEEAFGVSMPPDVAPPVTVDDVVRLFDSLSVAPAPDPAPAVPAGLR